jgi:hypothetical protein
MDNSKGYFGIQVDFNIAGELIAVEYDVGASIHLSNAPAR